MTTPNPDPNPETGWYRLENGQVIEMDHPLHEGIAGRVAYGLIVRVPPPGVEDNGTDYVSDTLPPVEPDQSPVEDARPKPADPKPAWVAYAISLGVEAETALGMTKTDLIDMCAARAAAAQAYVPPAETPETT